MTTPGVFEALYDDNDIVGMIRAARPLAREAVLTHGLCNDLIVQVQHLAGERESPAEWNTFCRWISAAYALGFAMGQIIDRDVLDRAAK